MKRPGERAAAPGSFQAALYDSFVRIYASRSVRLQHMGLRKALSLTLWPTNRNDHVECGLHAFRIYVTESLQTEIITLSTACKPFAAKGAKEYKTK